MRKRNLVYGVGINDADYEIAYFVDGKQVMCPYYRKWKAVLERCYSDKFQSRRPTYIGCTVADEWRLFSNFRVWMEAQDWQGKDLDKDIILIGNKVYSSETCAFVDAATNSLLADAKRNRGLYPQGVSRHCQVEKFQASIRMNNKQNYLGLFNTVEEAKKVYNEAKRLYILTIACCEPDIRVKQGLYRHSELHR